MTEKAYFSCKRANGKRTHRTGFTLLRPSACARLLLSFPFSKEKSCSGLGRKAAGKFGRTAGTEGETGAPLHSNQPPAGRCRTKRAARDK